MNVERVCDNSESFTYSLSGPNSLMYYASDESYQRSFYLNYQHLFWEGRNRKANKTQLNKLKFEGNTEKFVRSEQDTKVICHNKR